MGTHRPVTKKIVGFLHLWLGLTSGLVVFVVALTGAILTFQYPIEKHILNAHAWYAADEPGEHLPLDTLMAVANQHLKVYEDFRPVNTVILMRDSSHVVQLGYNYYEKDGTNHRAYVLLNPYTAGLTLITKNNAEHWIWHYIISLHVDLMLGTFGNYLVKWGTVIFLFQLISGIVLWWPKNKAAAKQRIWFRWTSKTRWRRQNYDLHNIPGFYACWVVFFMALTGSMWAFEWFNNGVYYALSWGGSPEAITSGAAGDSTTHIVGSAQLYNQALGVFREAYPYQYGNANSIILGYFSAESDSLLDIVATFDPVGLRADQFIEAMINKSNFSIARDNLKNFSTLAGTLNTSTNELHYGTFFGLTSQILTFFACLIAASLPITGFYIWLGRRRKQEHPYASPSVKVKAQRPAVPQ